MAGASFGISSSFLGFTRNFSMTSPTLKAKAIAFYLPQFHPIPENDAWWGKGFTEWTNVTKSGSRFEGHYQPHLPADLGFYDLRLDEVRIAQAELARRFNVSAFCYYHYWFEGRRLLNRPLDQLLASENPDFPFCICWANETWARNWDGLENQILVRQTYSSEDNTSHIKFLLGIFSDFRYFKINGEPLLLIYRPSSIPNFSSVIKEWREAAIKAGFPDLYVVGAKTGFINSGEEFSANSFGLDAILDFQPNRDDFPAGGSVKSQVIGLARKLLPDSLYQSIKSNASVAKVINYRDFASLKISKLKAADGANLIPCVFPSWDNSPRRNTPTIIQNDSPEIFGEWVSAACQAVQDKPKDERLFFVNAWNEWAEGCHLEPDRKFGCAFLEQLSKNVIL